MCSPDKTNTLKACAQQQPVVSVCSYSQEIIEKQSESLGADHADTLLSKGSLASLLVKDEVGTRQQNIVVAHHSC